MNSAITETSIPGLNKRTGKVRDIYDFDSGLVMVSTDRISAFDWVLPTGIPDKGRVLNLLSAFWFKHLGIRNHMVSLAVKSMDLPSETDLETLLGRAMLVFKVVPYPIECIVRGYLAGSAWKEYQSTGRVCDIVLPPGLTENEILPEPIFTPSTKAPVGKHDENIPFDTMVSILGDRTLAKQIRQRSLDSYTKANDHALDKGIIIADTKLEWGDLNNELTLIDEAYTPDSSRFWPIEEYEPGEPQSSFDKQFVRDWLTNKSGWDKNSAPPALPDEIVQKTRDKYISVYEKITGKVFRWK